MIPVFRDRPLYVIRKCPNDSDHPIYMYLYQTLGEKHTLGALLSSRLIHFDVDSPVIVTNEGHSERHALSWLNGNKEVNNLLALVHGQWHGDSLVDLTRCKLPKMETLMKNPGLFPFMKWRVPKIWNEVDFLNPKFLQVQSLAVTKTALLQIAD